MFTAYANELYTAFELNKKLEQDLKKDAAEQAKEDGGDAKAKKKKKEAPTSLAFGKGTRQFFDYLLSLNIESVE